MHRSCLPSCKAKSSGEAILLEDALHKAVTKHDQCQQEAVTTEELILPSPGHSVTLWVLQLLSLFSPPLCEHSVPSGKIHNTLPTYFYKNPTQLPPCLILLSVRARIQKNRHCQKSESAGAASSRAHISTG